MKESKREKLRKMGYRVTNTQAFLDLSDEEMSLIDLKISLIEKLKEIRRHKKLTQRQLAKLIDSSQSRVAMIERGAPDVTLDLICRAMLAMGVGRKEIGQAIIPKRAA